MKKPIIGISASVLYEKESSLFLGYERMYTNTDYIRSVERAGAVPCVLPIISDEASIDILISHCDGIIIMGGHDVDPQLFNEEPLIQLTAVCPQRDAFERALIKKAFLHKKPLFGICRGMQILNVVCGGSLYQDISYCTRSRLIAHVQKAPPSVPTHSIETKSGSLMHQIFGAKNRVNSFHHMAVKTVAPEFVATAHAPDGIVEAIEYTDPEHMVFGVQFHPEMMSHCHQASAQLFDAFVKRCSG